MDSFDRLIIGLPVATVLPALLPIVRERVLTRMLVAGLLVAWVVVPVSAPMARWPIGVLCVVAQVLSSRWVVVSAIAVGVAIAGTADADRTRSGLHYLVHSDRVVVVAFGAIAATVLMGALIGGVTKSLSKKAQEAMKGQKTVGIPTAGRYIGWAERAIVYGAVVLGRPEAVIVVLTGKSIARFPSFDQEAFAEYYLIGTLLSLGSAVAIGLSVRVILGLPAM
jgi:hypothetical protein